MHYLEQQEPLFKNLFDCYKDNELVIDSTISLTEFQNFCQNFKIVPDLCTTKEIQTIFRNC